MTPFSNFGKKQKLNGRVIGWFIAGLLLSAPFVAMQFTREVNWQVGDFIVFAVMLISVGVGFEFAFKSKSSRFYRIAMTISLIMTFLLVWLSLGVGIIGADGDPINLLYLAAISFGILVGVVHRFTAKGMFFALLWIITSQITITLFAIFLELGMPYSPPGELLMVNGIFVLLQATAALLFYKAAQEH